MSKTGDGVEAVDEEEEDKTADALEDGDSISACKAVNCGLSDGTSLELGLTGGPEFTEFGVSVAVDEHDGDDFGEYKFEKLSHTSILAATVAGDSLVEFNDTLTSGDEVDLGENKRVIRDLSEGPLDVGVVVVIE